MASTNHLISRAELIQSVMGILYRMSPYNIVPNAENIIESLIEAFNNKCTIYKDYPNRDKYAFAAEHFNDINELEKWLKETLFSIDAFIKLNISPKKQKAGQTTPDENEISFCGRGIPDLSQEEEFVDLYAALRNITNELWAISEPDTDCFLCKYAKEYMSSECGDNEPCYTCLGNPKIKSPKNNFEVHPWARLPKNSAEYKQLVAEGKITEM